MVKNPPTNAGNMRDTGWICELGRSPGATHSSVLVWRIPWTEEPGGPQSRGAPRFGHDGSDLALTGGRTDVSL